ncbi:vesicular transport-associated repeat protein, partial [Trypanosoma theileri]
MWGFFNDVKEAVRQTIVPKSEEVNDSQQAEPQLGPIPSITNIGDRLTTFLSTINTAASTIIKNTLGDSTEDPNNDPPPPLLRLTDEQRSALPPDELFRGLSEAVSIINTRSDMALTEARFLLSISLEEQIAHTNDFLNCYNWWEQLVNKRLTACQVILMEYSRLPGCESETTIQQLNQRIQDIRTKCTQDMALIAAKGRLLRDERYDILNATSEWYSPHSDNPIKEDQIERKHQPQYPTDTTPFNKDGMSIIPNNKEKINTANQEETKPETEKVEEEKEPKLAEEEARSPAEAEEARRLAEEQEARRLDEEEARRLAEEEEARRLAEEEEARRLAEEARRLAEEEEARRLAEEEEARRLAEEEEARRLAEEQETRRLAEDEARRLAEEEEARKLAEEEARRLAEEEARRLAEEQEARRLAEAEEARRLAEAEEARRLAE